MKRFFHHLSIKGRIALWYSALSLLIEIVFCVFVYFLLYSQMISYTKTELKSDLQRAVSETEIVWDAVKLKTDFNARQTQILVYSKDNRLLSGSSPDSVPLDPTMHEELFRVTIDGDTWLAADAPLSGTEYKGWIRAMKSLAPVKKTLNRLLAVEVSLMPIFLAASALGGLLIAKRSFRPINRIIDTAVEIGKGDLSKRINYDGPPDEIGNLALTLDGMLGKLEESFQREKQFANDASHELRTPITVIHSYAEEALD